MEIEARLARLEERTTALQRDVTDIKSTLTRVGVKLDDGKDTVCSLAVRVATVESKLDAKATTFDARLSAMASSFDAKLIGIDAKLNARE